MPILHWAATLIYCIPDSFYHLLFKVIGSTQYFTNKVAGLFSKYFNLQCEKDKVNLAWCGWSCFGHTLTYISNILHWACGSSMTKHRSADNECSLNAAFNRKISDLLGSLYLSQFFKYCRNWLILIKHFHIRSRYWIMNVSNYSSTQIH